MLSSITHTLWVAQIAFTFVNRALAVNNERLVLFGGEALANFLALEDRLNRDANTGAHAHLTEFSDCRSLNDNGIVIAIAAIGWRHLHSWVHQYCQYRTGTC